MVWKVQKHAAYIDRCGDAGVAATPGVSIAAHHVGAEATTAAADEERPAAGTTAQAAATAAEASAAPQDAETLLGPDVTADDGDGPAIAPAPGQANGVALGQAGVGGPDAQARQKPLHNTRSIPTCAKTSLQLAGWSCAVVGNQYFCLPVLHVTFVASRMRDLRVHKDL